MPAVMVSRFWYLFHKTVAPPLRTGVESRFVVRLASPADAGHFAAFAPRRPALEMSAWSREPGTLIFIVFAEGRAVGYDCVSRSLPATAPFSALKLRDEQVWVRDIYTVPAWRGYALARILRVHRNAALRARGVRGTLSAVSEDNVPSLISSYDGNVSRIEGLHYTRVLIYRHVGHYADARARLDGVIAKARLHVPSRVLALDTSGARHA